MADEETQPTSTPEAGEAPPKAPANWRSLPRRRFLRIGLFSEDMGPYGEQAVGAISMEASKSEGRLQILVANFGEITAAAVAARKLDGVIFGRWERPAELLDALQKSRLPVVDIWGSSATECLPHKVMPDDFAVGKMAAEHFLKRGFSQFGYYGLPKSFNLRWEERRRAGFVQTVQAAGFKCEAFETLATGWEKLHEEQNLSGVAGWLRALPKPVGILCCIDSMAYEVIRLSRERRLLVPDRIAVCGVDNRLWICNLANPAITSIPLDGAAAGRGAIRLLVRMIRRRYRPQAPVYIPPLPLEARGSTDVYSFADAEVVRVIRYIRDHANVPISVEDVLAQSFISRRGLEIRFREATGETLQASIWRAHTERAKQLLLESQLSIAEVADQAGFSSHAVFNVRFQRETGTSPTKFRRRELRKPR